MQTDLEPVFLNVYDLLSQHRSFSCCFSQFYGIYHTSVQIYDVEYYFADGIRRCQPYTHAGQLIMSKQIGLTAMSQQQIENEILGELFDQFTVYDYDLLRWNCNHFTDRFLFRLLGLHLSRRYNRAERCLLASPCCLRTLDSILGEHWTRPITSIKSRRRCC